MPLIYGPCIVCGLDVYDEPHTHHAEGCPARLDVDAECVELSYCGEDIHEACCPTCNPPVTLTQGRDGRWGPTDCHTWEDCDVVDGACQYAGCRRIVNTL